MKKNIQLLAAATVISLVVILYLYSPIPSDRDVTSRVKNKEQDTQQLYHVKPGAQHQIPVLHINDPIKYDDVDHKTGSFSSESEQSMTTTSTTSSPTTSRSLVASSPSSENRSSARVENTDAAGYASGLMCGLAESEPASTDIQMFDVLDQLNFALIQDGIWESRHPFYYNTSRWTNTNPLQLYVVPHSHTDPGWLKTFEGYYTDNVRQILNNMVVKLQQYKKLKFIYAEMSFFSRWWEELDSNRKQQTIQLLSEGRLELVAGGWVMPDEAAAHYFAMVDQLIEGHTWIRNNIGTDIYPRSGWAIDPFGHTSTMAYLLKQSGLHNMLIQRVHYSVKEYFSLNKLLEFNWRQIWDGKGETDILSHMLPYNSYTVGRSCGPDSHICCEFDYKGDRCGGIRPIFITDDNIEERASVMLDQLRKKSTLFRSNVLLMPLGDDFRYSKPSEWDLMFTNYQKLFDYMNQRSDWNIRAQFGTLSDYFNQLRLDVGKKHPDPAVLPDYPTLSGDFYTYADRGNQYWSGYFTTRPFYKHWDRHLESTLRSAEIIFTLAKSKLGSSANKLYSHLTKARRSLGLFQHHDGITGTARSFVVKDYGNRMLEGWTLANEVIESSTQALLQKPYSNSEKLLNIDWLKTEQDSLEKRQLHTLTNGQRQTFVFYNSHPHEREEVVTLHVDTEQLQIYDAKSQLVSCQIAPYFTTNTDVSSEKFVVHFIAVVPALGLSTYHIQKANTRAGQCKASSVTFYNVKAPIRSPIFNTKTKAEKEFEICNSQLSLLISTKTGMAKAVTQAGERTRLDMDFISFGTSKTYDGNSGAYLFIPDGNAKLLTGSYPPIRVVIGDVVQEVTSFRHEIKHSLRIVNTNGPESRGVDIVNIDDITHEDSNFELGLRLSTDIHSRKSATFYSDLNGFTMHKRKYREKLQIGGNVYPMTSMSYIEDDSQRLTMLTSQSAGVMSLQPGELQIILDRRFVVDDHRGLGEPITDTKITESRFFLLLEKRSTPAKLKPIGYPSITANILYHHMVSPLTTLPVSNKLSKELGVSDYSPLKYSLPCELHMLNLRSLADGEGNIDSSLLLLHHQAADCSLPSQALTCVQTSNDGLLDVAELFRDIPIDSIEKTTLTDLEVIDSEVKSPIQVKPMTIDAFRVKFKH